MAPHVREEFLEDPVAAVTTPIAPARELAERLVRDQFRIIETGQLGLAATNVTPGFVNHRSVHEPLAARATGPAALAATATWLRRAFSDIRFEIDEVAVIADRAIAWVTLHAVNTGPFVVHDAPDGSVTQVFPPTGREFAVRQVHWFRIEDGAIAEHDAVRDDLGMAQQVGWIPPRPGYVIRMLAARRRERRATAQALRAARGGVG
jgi:predicted ester cyclase